jgi:hypothetical protein
MLRTRAGFNVIRTAVILVVIITAMTILVITVESIDCTNRLCAATCVTSRIFRAWRAFKLDAACADTVVIVAAVIVVVVQSIVVNEFTVNLIN